VSATSSTPKCSRDRLDRVVVVVESVIAASVASRVSIPSPTPRRAGGAARRRRSPVEAERHKEKPQGVGP